MKRVVVVVAAMEVVSCVVCALEFVCLHRVRGRLSDVCGMSMCKLSSSARVKVATIDHGKVYSQVKCE